MDKVNEHGGKTRLIYDVDSDSFSTWIEYVALEKPPTFETPRPYNEYSKKQEKPQVKERPVGLPQQKICQPAEPLQKTERR